MTTEPRYLKLDIVSNLHVDLLVHAIDVVGH